MCTATTSFFKNCTTFCIKIYDVMVSVLASVFKFVGYCHVKNYLLMFDYFEVESKLSLGESEMNISCMLGFW
jgi:hypothetical protein